MMSSCATVVPSFGLQVTTVMDCGLIIWYKKLVLLLGALLEVRHPHQHLQPKVLSIQLIAQITLNRSHQKSLHSEPKLCSPFKFMLCNKPMPQRGVLQPVGLLRNKRAILRRLLPKWKLLGQSPHISGFSAYHSS